MSSSPPRPDRVINVAVPVPGLGLLSYLAPAGPTLHKGARVRVPLGSRSVVGCVTDPEAIAPAGQELRAIGEVIDPEPFVPADVVDLALWVGEYYASGPGAALALAMPPAARDGTRESFRTTRMFERVEPDLLPTDPAPTPKQQRALDIVAAQASGLSGADAAKQGVGAAMLRTLVTRGWLHVRDDVVLRDPFDDGGTDDGGQLVHRRAAEAGA